MKETKEKGSDRGSFCVLLLAAFLFLYITVYDALYVHFTFYSSIFFFYLGIVIILTGFALRFYSEKILARQFSLLVKIQKKHKLITADIYGHVRHPIYSALLLKAFGFALMMNSVWGMVALVFILLPCLLYRIFVEEKALGDHFGKEYIEYKKRTKALIPGVV